MITASEMTADQLREWMRDHGYTVRGLATMLDRAPNTIQRYRSGQEPIPRVIVLALRGLESQT